MRPSVLMVDDDPAILRAVARQLGHDFDVRGVDGASSALALLASGAVFDALIVDLYMPEANGRETLERIRAVAPDLAGRAILLTTGPTDPELAAWCETLGDRVVFKPPSRAVLAAALNGVLADASALAQADG